MRRRRPLLRALAGVTDPEEKRKTIGELFIRIFEEAAGGASRTPASSSRDALPRRHRVGHGDAAAIKSHHNVGGLPDDMDFELVEPLRQPVQGRGAPRRQRARPARRDRVAPAVPRPRARRAHHRRGHPEKVAILQHADAIVREEIRAAGLEREIWQAFAVLPDIRSVGVMGDERTYAHPIIIRAVTSEDAMTADWARLPYDLLERMSSRIINEVPGASTGWPTTSRRGGRRFQILNRRGPLKGSTGGVGRGGGGGDQPGNARQATHGMN